MIVFIDDILVYLKTPEEQAYHLREFLEVLRKHELYAKLKRCEFWLEKVAFLGHVVSKEGISVDPQKIETVTQWPKPKNITEVKSFLGLEGYYHKFVQIFLGLPLPLLT